MLYTSQIGNSFLEFRILNLEGFNMLKYNLLAFEIECPRCHEITSDKVKMVFACKQVLFCIPVADGKAHNTVIVSSASCRIGY